jgi:glycosyltransferase involved in cell wall biosynthesis
MRILFFGAHFPRPNNTTIGTWALSQVRALKEAGHEVRVIAPVAAIPRLVSRILGRGSSAVCPARHDWSGIEAFYVRWPVYPVGPPAKLLRKYPGIFVTLGWMAGARRFLSLARRFAPDVVFAHHGQLGGFVAARVARSLGVPYFITEHNFNDIESCADDASRRTHYLAATRGIGSWIAVSNRMRDSMQRIFPAVRSVTVHNGADVIPAELHDVPKPAHLAGRLVVLCATFFYKRKNVPLLIQAFDSIAKQHPSANLVVIGDGEDRQAVHAAFERALHRSQITLLGALPHRDVLQHMIWCDVFVNIGVDEPFATVFSEAMMAGRPIIFSSDGGITDVVQDGTQGLAVAPGDSASVAEALDRLLTDTGLRSRLGASARVLANGKLTWTKNAENILTLFRGAVDRQP